MYFFLNLNSPGKWVPTAKPPLQVRRAVSRWGIIDAPVSLEQHRLFSPEPQETLELEKAGNHHTESSGRHSARGSRLFLLLSTKKHKAVENCAHGSDLSAERSEHRLRAPLLRAASRQQLIIEIFIRESTGATRWFQ